MKEYAAKIANYWILNKKTSMNLSVFFKFNIKLNPNPKESLKVNHETHSEKLPFFIS